MRNLVEAAESITDTHVFLVLRNTRDESSIDDIFNTDFWG